MYDQEIIRDMIEKPFHDSRNGNDILKNATLNYSDQSLDSGSHCNASALKHEQLGYYVWGASQFDAVIYDACSVGVGE
ncbi:MAG TPA: hypothetical protein VH500_21905 [Nitrososphaeraceae archaeon]|jgi:hypothetical protein